MSAEFAIRPAAIQDLIYLRLLFKEDGMPVPADADFLSGTVAVNAHDEAIGFIRILEINDQTNPAGSGAFVYPVIVFKLWQGHGVGKALIRHELKKRGELRLVACKASRDFYPKCGFEQAEWEQIAGTIAHDCELCPELQDCDPQPFIAVVPPTASL